MSRLKCLPFTPFCILSLCLSSPRLSAQTARVVPASAATTGGNTFSFPPFVVDAGLMQQLVDGSKLSVRSSLIRAIAYRHQTGNSGTVLGRRIPRLIVRLGHSKRSPATMASTFAQNRSGRMITVFSGAYNLPTQTGTGVKPWNIAWKLANPFAYLNVNGDLLVEIEMPGNAQNKFRYALDAFVSGTSGSHRSFGTKGPFKTGDRYNMFSSLDQLRPGGEAKLQVVLLKQAYPALAIYGASKQRFGAFTLPLDLGRAGAPLNFLYVSMDLVLPMQVRMIAPGSFSASMVLPLPNLSALAGATLYGQTFFVDRPSNALGLVFSNATEMILGGGPAAPTNAVHGLDTSRPSGGFVFPGRTGAPVIRLTGAFN
ncbi:MAG: hypothetical protein ACE5F1_18630 [Planctomycetota bacterium]